MAASVVIITWGAPAVGSSGSESYKSERYKMDERQNLFKQLKVYSGFGWMAATLAAGGAVALIVCGVIIVKPIVETNSLEFQETTCTTTQSYLTGRWITCSCGDKCSSSYPCLRMTVTYVPTNTNNASSVAAVLFDTEQRLNSAGDNAEDYQCVTAPCESYPDNNRLRILMFNDTYAPGKNYSCLHHPNATTQVLLKRLFTWDDMFHSMLWSSIGFVVFAGITVYIMVQCNKIRERLSSIHVSSPPQGHRPGHFLPPPPGYPGVQSGGFLPPPPGYPGVQSGGFLPPPPGYAGVQPGRFLPPPPGYAGVQSGESLQMHPAPQHQDPYSYSTDNKGFTYS
ncbi:Hypp5877 [Branchiostoma lanceolatum]|uniref:Hypp5877 protein n=1 Tax=Branchiostoma lanceolatum TaxID=7740 RepID=A0A8J9W4H8_BRALA|nr:Hypp5877 [Branchiostoma lanceolatum]